jgi:hypothetical protein
MGDVREDESVVSKLFYVVKHISDQVNGDLINLIYPLLDNLEYVPQMLEIMFSALEL